MNWKNRLTNYNFWISIISAILLILQAFKFEFDIAYINEIATAVLGLMVVIGIISDPTKTYNIEKSKQETKEEIVAEPKAEHRETLEMPNENKVENSNNTFEDDFKVVMNKITEDINNNLSQINEIKNTLLSEMHSNSNILNEVEEPNDIQNL